MRKIETLLVIENQVMFKMMQSKNMHIPITIEAFGEQMGEVKDGQGTMIVQIEPLKRELI